MEHSKLKTPLFYGNSFNREGRKMRAVFVREIFDGETSYRLWRGTGKPDQSYPRAENDRYLLYTEINGYLLPLRMTEFFLIDHCGFAAAVKKLYGSSEERGRHFTRLRESEGEAGVLAALDAEKEEIERLGCAPNCQVTYIRRILDEHISTYLNAKETGGRTFPDFAGALIMGELDTCAALSEVYTAEQREKRLIRAARAKEENKEFCDEQNRSAERIVSTAIQIILNGGVLKNETVTFYRSKYDSSTYSIFNHLMRLYHIEVPLRTQGWINEKLTSVTIQGGKCEQLRYLKAKNGRCSQKFFGYMNRLLQAVTMQVQPETEEEKTA